MNTYECARCTAVMPEKVMEWRGGKWWCRNTRACAGRERAAREMGMKAADRREKRGEVET